MSINLKKSNFEKAATLFVSGDYQDRKKAVKILVEKENFTPDSAWDYLSRFFLVKIAQPEKR